METNIINKAKRYAVNCHKEANHLYNGSPYEIHLEMVYKSAIFFSYLIPENDRESFIAAAWTHDLIEDCRQTYNDVLNATNEQVAELTYALTNEKGKTRKERANQKYYAGIRACPHAILLKVCDRIANLQYSIDQKSRMRDIYAKEMRDFLLELYDEKYKDAFEYLEGMV